MVSANPTERKMAAIQALQKELGEVKKMFNALKVAIEKEEIEKKKTLEITIKKDGKKVNLGALGNSDIQIYSEIVEDGLDDGFGMKKLKTIVDKLNDDADEPIWHINTAPDGNDESPYWELCDIPDGVIPLIKGKTFKIKSHISIISIMFS